MIDGRIAVEPESLFGLPAHPLLVHLPVVVIPVTAVVAVLAVALPRWRRALAPVAAGLALVGAAGAILAAGSGEALEGDLTVAQRVLVHDHAELGEGLRTIALLMALACAGLVAHARPEWFRLGPDSRLRAVLTGRAGAVAVSVAVVALAALSAYWTVRTGHTGAEAVWSEAETTARAGR